MARLLKKMDTTISNYRDRRFRGSQEDFDHCLRTSTTVYVGNLSFYSTEEQIYEAFSKCGDIKRIIMGLHQQNKTPCGFCFVVFYTREDTEDCVKYINGTTLDDRPVRVDFDWGFQEGRQFGRGASGGQVRDEYRMEYDEGRGGFGQIIKEEVQMAHMGSPHTPQGGGFGRRQRDFNTPKERYERGPPAKRQRTVGGGGSGGGGGEKQDGFLPREGQQPQRNPRFRDDDSDNED